MFIDIVWSDAFKSCFCGFLDMERGYLLFFIDYIAIIILLATLAHHLGKLLKQRSLKANRLAKEADSSLLP